MHPLEAKLRSIRRRLHCWVVLHGLARLVTVVGVGVVFLGGVDYWMRFQDPGLRLIVSIAFLVVVGWAIYRFVLRPAWRPYSEIGLSLGLEQCFPVLADRLASSVAFLRQTHPDPTAGSPRLRKEVIAQTTEQVASIDFREALNARPVVQALVGALATALVAAGLVLIDPTAARIALARLVMPLENISWPQRTHLILVHRVERISRGDPFELLVEETAGKLPDDLRIHYRLELPEGTHEESEPIRRIAQRTEDGQWKEVGRVRREGLLYPFWYRLTGGDDTSMEWIRVEVLEPPRLENSQVRLFPPAYTGLPPETAGQWIRALVGTRVEISGQTSRPVDAVVLITEGGQAYSAHLGPDKRAFQIARLPASGPRQTLPSEAGFSQPKAQENHILPKDAAVLKPEGLYIRQSGRWRLRLIDPQGLEHEATGWEVRVVSDLPPSLTLESPPPLTYATPRAVVPIRVKVKDDLGVRRVDLLAGLEAEDRSPRQEATSPGQKQTAPTADRQWGLYEGPSQPVPRTKGFSSGGDLAQQIPTIEYRWHLASWNLQAGVQIVFHVRATDYAGQTTSSEPHRIVLLEPQQYLERVVAQQNAILAELAQLLQKQRTLRDQLAEQEKMLMEGNLLGQRELDRLRSLELLQRQVHGQLTNSPESLLARLENLLANLENNHLDQADLQRRLAYLRAGLARLQNEHLPLIGQQFITAIKTAQAGLESNGSGKPLRPSPAIGEAIRSVLVHQDHVIQTLETWLGRLRPSVQTQRFSQELAHLLRDQQTLAEHIRQIAQTTLTKELRELGPQELADLQSASRQQGDLARRMERLQQDMADLLRELQSVDPLPAQGLAEAVRYAQEAGLASAIQITSQDILQNRMGQVLQTLPHILQNLQKLSDLLANRREQEFSRWLPLLQQTEQELTNLLKKQQELHGTLESAGQKEPSARTALLQQAADRQAALTPEAQKLLERFEQLLLEDPAQAMRTAVRAMERTEQTARQADTSQAVAQSQAALQAIEQAWEHLASQRLQTQAAWIAQQLTRLREALPSLYDRQEKVWKETVRLEEVRKTTGTLDPQNQLLLADLARQQQELHDQAAAWAQKLADLSVLQMALEELAHCMDRAAQQLAQAQTGPDVQQAQQEALARLQLVLEALREEPLSIPLPKETPPSGKSPSGATPRTVVSAAELKLLRLWQQSLHVRTQTFYKTFGDKPPDRPEVRSQYESLRREQAQLAQMVEQILRAASTQESNK